VHVTASTGWVSKPPSDFDAPAHECATAASL
jgi:hypothetical protein